MTRRFALTRGSVKDRAQGKQLKIRWSLLKSFVSNSVTLAVR